MIRTGEKLNINNMNHLYNVKHNSEKIIILQIYFGDIPNTTKTHFKKMWLDLNWYEYHFLLKIFLYAQYTGEDIQYDYWWTHLISLMNGGGGIRTHGTLADTLVFKTIIY